MSRWSKPGVEPARAFRRAAETARAWAVALEELVSTRLPGAGLVLFFDEPALVQWRRGRGLLEREAAIDVLSGALAAAECTTGVHVCGDGDLGLALEAGPQVVGIEVRAELVRDAVPIARFLDGDGWIAWGAVPTDRPVGESADPHWRHLAEVWCELTRRGCRSGAAAHARDDHSRVWPCGLRCLAGRAGARDRTGAGGSGPRSGRRRPTHAGSLSDVTSTQDFRYCGVCGAPLDAGATACGNCGAAVEATGATGAVAATPVDEPTGAGEPTGEPTIAMPAAAAAAGGGGRGGAEARARAAPGRRRPVCRRTTTAACRRGCAG